MGVEKFKRPILAKEGIQVGGATSPSTFVGQVNFSNAVSLSSGFSLRVENVATAAAAPTLSAHGISFITYGTSSVAGDVILPDPPAAGALKYIFAENMTTSVELNINAHSSANAFWGTTQNTIVIAAASTGSPGGTPAGTAAIVLVGKTTNLWAVLPGSTFNWDFTATTGSTDSTST